MNDNLGFEEWLTDAADLLARPDPGPTPWLVQDLIVDRALVACVGRWKTTKSYGLLDIAISVATGRPAFGKLACPIPDGEEEHGGPVIFVNEESGEAALWRRLDALCRGRGIRPEELRGRLLLAANMRVKLDDPDWKNRLIEACLQTSARLTVFDPLARMKAATRDENAQTDMAVVVDNIREIRDETDAAIAFVQHTGHQGEHMRGTSDLESVWETKLAWKKDGNAITVTSEHREAESAGPIKYRLSWDHDTRTMRIELEEDETRAKVADYLAEHPDASANEVYKELKGNRGEVLAIVKELRCDTSEPLPEGGTNAPVPPGYHPPAGTPDGGTRVGLSEPPGTTSRGPGTNGSVPPLFDDALLAYLDFIVNDPEREVTA